MFSKIVTRISIFCILLVLFSGMAIAANKGLIYYLAPCMHDEMQTTAAKMIKEAVEAAGYNCRVLTAGQEDASLQLDQLENAISQNPKAIIIAAVDGIAITSGVEKAKAQGIPVIAFDRTISETQVDFHSVAGCRLIGTTAGHEIARLLQERHGAFRGRVLDIMGDPSDSYTTLIEEGFREVMEQYPDVIIDTKIASNWEASNAADIADDYLVANPATDLIFTHADHLAASVVAVLQNRGYNKGDILIVSTAGMPTGLNLIREGWMTSTVEQPAGAQAEGVAMFLDDVISGKEIPLGEYNIKGIEAELLVMPYGLELRTVGNLINADNVEDPVWWGNQAD